MRTILIIAGIVLVGATVITVVQKDKKKDAAPEIHHAGDGHDHPAEPPLSPSATPSINPAHGLAGHRCDLPVGAPLTTVPTTAVPAQTAPTIKMNPSPRQTIPVSPSATPSPSGVKINPAHGMPGHRCDIQVGAPLT